MLAIKITEFGGPDVLRPIEVPTPAPGAGEVLIRTHAAGVNHPDMVQRAGRYPPPPRVTDIPGLEIAGEIVAVGAGCARWRVGDRVCALVAGGGYADYCTAPEPQCLPIPRGLDMVQAAALPETFFTVWTNVFERGALTAGETILIHGGAGGIGTTAIQLARVFGATVLTTAGSPEKCRLCLDLGAARAINYRTEDFVEAVKASTAGAGANVILDILCGEYMTRNLRSLAYDGRLVIIALQGGAKAEIDFRHVLARRQTITGSSLRPRTPAQKGAIAAALEEKVWPLLESGSVRPIVTRTLRLDQAADAHRHLESGAHQGKVVLTTAALGNPKHMEQF
jgi:putative PIG3 family NAD(P)H quinone oxidoreductase